MWELYSNQAWSHTQDIALTKAPKDVKGGDAQAFVWSRCQKGKQTIAFSRTVELPGPPSRLAFSIYSRIRGAPSDDGSVQIVVNGKSIYKTEVYAFQPTDVSLDSAGRHAAFNYLRNIVELIITKSSRVACRENGKEFGVAWKLQGFSQADLGIRKKSVTFYRKTGSVGTLQAAIPIENLGPDAFLGAQFSITLDYANNLSHNNTVLVKSVTPQAPYGACTGPTDVSKTGPPPWLLQYGSGTCSAGEPIPPDAKTGVDFVVLAGWENGVDSTYHNWGEYELSIDVRSTGAFYDPNSDNDMITIHVVLCGNGNNNPDCSKAT